MKFQPDCSPSLYPLRKPRSAYAEAVRSVYVNLQFAKLDRPPRVVMVTSSLPGEGKTSLAVSLAASAAASGFKTIVLDLDLRHPSVRVASTQPSTAPGIAELVTADANFEEVVYRDPALPNLDMVTVRRNPVNRSDVLASKQIAQRIAKLRTKYKLIVLDTPPSGRSSKHGGIGRSLQHAPRTGTGPNARLGVLSTPWLLISLPKTILRPTLGTRGSRQPGPQAGRSQTSERRSAAASAAPLVNSYQAGAHLDRRPGRGPLPLSL